MTEFEQNRIYNQSLKYFQGQGVPRDASRAFELNLEAAKMGHADAVLAMGWFYLGGRGVERNVEQSKRWYRDSARRGESRAMFSLGQIAEIEGDYSEARIWFERAIKANHARSLYWLGKLYWRGQGVELSRKEAIHLIHKAADLKVEEAVRFLRFRTR